MQAFCGEPRDCRRISHRVRRSHSDDQTNLRNITANRRLASPLSGQGGGNIQKIRFFQNGKSHKAAQSFASPVTRPEATDDRLWRVDNGSTFGCTNETADHPSPAAPAFTVGEVRQADRRQGFFAGSAGHRTRSSSRAKPKDLTPRDKQAPNRYGKSRRNRRDSQNARKDNQAAMVVTERAGGSRDRA